MSEYKSPLERAELALQASGLTPSEASAAMGEVQAHIYENLCMEISVASRNNPYRGPLGKVRWYAGLTTAWDIVFRRKTEAEARIKYHRRQEGKKR